MSINIIEQQEKLLLACVTLNFVEDLEEFKEFLELSAEEKGYKAVLEYVADMIDNEVSDKTLEKVYQDVLLRQKQLSLIEHIMRFLKMKYLVN